MIRKIPQNRRWEGPYSGNYIGDLWKTFNIDLDRSDGKICLSERMTRIEDSNEILSLGSGGFPVRAFLRTDADCEDRYWALSDTDLYNTDSQSTFIVPNVDWDTDRVANSPNANRDMAVIGNDSRNDCGRNQLFVTLDTDIAVLNDTGNNAWTANWWTVIQGQAPLDSNATFHPIEYFPFQKIGLVGDGNKIHTISRPSDTQNDTITYARLILPLEHEVRHIFTTAERAWFLTKNKIGEGAVVEWDGFSQTYNKLHKIGASVAMTGVNYSEVPIIINSNGIVMEFTGNGFSPVIRNGQVVALPFRDGLLLSPIYSSDSSYPSIISPRGAVKTEDDLIYINTTPFGTGQARFNGGIWCLNMKTGRLYNKYSLTTDTNSFGYQVATPGGIFAIPHRESAISLLASGSLAVGLGVQGGIWTVDTTLSKTQGYIITQFILADEVKEWWDVLYLKFLSLKNYGVSGSSLIVKARGVRSLIAGRAALNLSATWTSTTTFTVTNSASDDAIAIGDEVEVIAGENSGWIVHVSDISGAHGGLQTITIDEAVPTATSTSSIIFDRWKKIGTITDTNLYDADFPIGIDSSFIQFKIVIRGNAFTTEISDLLIKSKSSKII